MKEEHVSLRPACLADADAIRTLTRAAYAKWVPVVGREPRPMMADYHAAVERHAIDLLFAGATLAALVEMIPAPDYLLIENLAVSPAFQGRGFGRRLLAHTEDQARVRGLGEMRLYTNRLFAENIRLYASAGYAIDHEETWAGGVIVHMRKPIRPTATGDERP